LTKVAPDWAAAESLPNAGLSASLVISAFTRLAVAIKSENDKVITEKMRRELVEVSDG
jgi:hypothetical protein